MTFKSQLICYCGQVAVLNLSLDFTEIEENSLNDGSISRGFCKVHAKKALSLITELEGFGRQ